MKGWLKSKKNLVISSVIFLLVAVIIFLGIVINDKAYKLSQKNTELTAANGTINEYSSEIEEHKKTESELQSEIDKYKAENDSLKQQITELAAKKEAARQAALTKTNNTPKPASQPVQAPAPPPEEINDRINALIDTLSFPQHSQQNPAASKVCYLTFDDGPSKNTPAILDILSRYNVKATFFVIGTGNLDLLPRMVSEGHAIGLHANNHTYAGIYSGTEAYLSDLLAISQKVEAKIGQKVNIMRFPGGSSNEVSKKYCSKIMTLLTTLLPNMGYQYFDWNVSSGDADKALVPATEIINRTISRATGKDSICLLMHDAAAKTTTVDALPSIIEQLSAMGFSFETLNNSTFGYHQTVRN